MYDCVQHLCSIHSLSDAQQRLNHMQNLADTITASAVCHMQVMRSSRTRQGHLSLEDIVPERGGRKPALLAADMAVHMQGGVSCCCCKAPLRQDFISADTHHLSARPSPSPLP